MRNRGRCLSVAIVVVVVVPLLVALILLVGDHGFAPNSDVALIELRTRDVGGLCTPLVGPYERFGWNQPGPLLFYLLAIPYRLSGGHYWGLAAGAVLVNATSLVGIALVTWRRSGVALTLWSMVLLALAARAIGSTDLSDPWEPNITVLPCALLLFLAWDVAAGRPAALPVAVGVASFLVQSQPGLAAYSLALLAWAAAWPLAGAFREPAREERRRRLRALVRVGAWAVGVGLVLWAAPALEELLHAPGNLSRTWDFFVHGHRDTLGFGRAWEAVALQLDLRGRWLFHTLPLKPLRPDVDTGAAGPVPVALLALAAGAYLARRRGDHEALRLCGTVVLAVATAVLSLSRVVGPLYTWILAWTRVLGLGCWLAAGWATYRAIRPRLTRRPTAALAALLGVLLAVSSTSAVTDAADPEPNLPIVDAVHRAAARAAPDLRDGSGPVLVRSEAVLPQILGSTKVGFGLSFVVLAFDKAGLSVVVERDLANRFDRWRARPRQATREVVLVYGEVDESLEDEGFRVLATGDPLTPDERATRERLTRELAELQAALPTPDEHETEDLRRRFVALAEQWNTVPDYEVFTLLVRDLSSSSAFES